MNDQWGYENNDNASQGENLDGPKALREAYSALKKQNEELNATVTSFIQEQKQQKLAGVFESLGVPDAAKVYSGEADPEKAKQWVESMRGVFGGGNNPTPEPQGISQDQQAALERMTQAGSNGTPMGNFEAAESNMGSVQSTDEIVALMRKLSHGG